MSCVTKSLMNVTAILKQQNKLKLLSNWLTLILSQQSFKLNPSLKSKNCLPPETVLRFHTQPVEMYKKLFISHRSRSGIIVFCSVVSWSPSFVLEHIISQPNILVFRIDWNRKEKQKVKNSFAALVVAASVGGYL